MKTSLFSAFVAISLFAGWSSASAGTIRVTYSGVASGYDRSGLFGSPGTDLDGESYQATYVFDLSSAYYYDAGYGFTDLNISGYASYYGLPFVSATTAINGHSVTVKTQQNGGLTWTDDGSVFGSNAYYAQWDTINEMENSLISISGSLPREIDHNITYMVQPTDKVYAHFYFDGEIDGFPGSSEAHGYPLITEVTISVPEPATWGMITLGFVGLGFLGYRSSHRVM
jgi:hypothetical protein